jgi:hypothetical protein
MSDDFDEFDNDLANLNFEEIDKVAASILPPTPSQQQPRIPFRQPQQQGEQPQAKRTTQPYHHTVSVPSKAPTRPKIKDPGPINTEPRAAGQGAGFGWEYGGKRSIDGNLERHLGNVKTKDEYWGLNSPAINNKPKEEEDFPDVVLSKNGGYGFSIPDKEKESTHDVMKSVLASQYDVTAAARRRQAIAESQRQVDDPNANAVAGPSVIDGQRQQPIRDNAPGGYSQQQFSARTLSRSVSAGNAQTVQARPQSRNNVGHLPTIASQPQSSSSEPVASQGSLARKTAIELDEERRKREAAEKEVERLKVESQMFKAERERLRRADRTHAGNAIRSEQEETWRERSTDVNEGAVMESTRGELDNASSTERCMRSQISPDTLLIGHMFLF